jgi:hypothetical protein
MLKGGSVASGARLRIWITLGCLIQKLCSQRLVAVRARSTPSADEFRLIGDVPAKGHLTDAEPAGPTFR